MTFGAISLLAATFLSATGGDVVPAMAQQKPFPASDGFVVEARMNRSDGPRHAYGLSLVSVGEGPVLAVGETPDGLDATVTAVAAGKSVTLAHERLALPEEADLRQLPCFIGYDAQRRALWFAVGEGEKATRVEFPAPADVKGESYRIVPSQVPGLLKVSIGKGE